MKINPVLMLGADTDTVRRANVFIVTLFKELIREELHFHNLKHTQEVVKASAEASSYLGISAEQKEVLLVAAWFHDAGYIIAYDEHEEPGAIIVRNFLQSKNWKEDRIQQVEQCILATSLPQKPQSLMEEIICDADLSHLAAGDYLEQLDCLRKEWQWAYNQQKSDEEWVKLNLDFLQKQQYFTTYGQEILQPRLEENIKLLFKKL